MKEAFVKIKEAFANIHRVVKTDEDMEWNRAVYKCSTIVSEVEEEYGNVWIPVKQRLPEESSDVLIATRSSIVEVGTYFENIGWVQWYSGGSIAVDVTHWQPLPSLPKPYKPTTD